MNDLVRGARVLLVRLEAAFFDGLADEDASRLLRLVGKEWIVEGVMPETELVELVFAHQSGDLTPIDWVTVPTAWVERLT